MTQKGLFNAFQDLYLLDGVRTPMVDYCGALGHVSPTDLGIKAARAALARAAVAPTDIDTVIAGNMAARAAMSDPCSTARRILAPSRRSASRASASAPAAAFHQTRSFFSSFSGRKSPSQEDGSAGAEHSRQIRVVRVPETPAPS